MERKRFPRFLMSIDGVDVLCTSIPVQKYRAIMQTSERRRKRIINLEARATYYRGAINRRIKKIDLLIETLSK